MSETLITIGVHIHPMLDNLLAVTRQPMPGGVSTSVIREINTRQAQAVIAKLQAKKDWQTHIDVSATDTRVVSVSVYFQRFVKDKETPGGKMKTEEHNDSDVSDARLLDCAFCGARFEGIPAIDLFGWDDTAPVYICPVCEREQMK